MALAASSAQGVNALRLKVEGDARRAPPLRVALAFAMAAVVAAVAGLAYWDAERESTAALQDFAEEQSTLATALGAALRLRSSQGRALDERDVLAELRSIERAKTLAIFLHRPGESVLRATDGRALASPRLIEAAEYGQAVLRVSRDEAATFGLPARTALAGISRVDGGRAGSWNVVAVASAQRERDRELWARRRLVLSVFTAGGLVLAFGGVAMRMQRKELVGTIFGNANPRRDIPRLLKFYMDGHLLLDELVTTTYDLEDINQGYQDMRDGVNIRGVVTYS